MALPQVEYSVDNNASPAKITLTFKGTCNCPLGHAIDPSVTSVAKKIHIMRQKKEEEMVSEDNVKKKKEDLKKRRREEFLQTGVYKALYGTLERKIQCASMCTDHLLNLRKDKLRKMLLAEEESYAKEYITMCQAASQEKEESLRQKALAIKAKMEQDREELAAKKKFELKIQDCEPARPYMSQIAQSIVKQDQLWQIKEKYAREEARREEDRMYHDLMMKNLLEMQERDEEDARLQWLKQKEIKETFKEQMKWREIKDQKEKELKELERRQIEETVRRLNEEAEKEIEEKRKRNAKMIAEYQEYMAREKVIRERRQKEEDEIDKAYTKLMQIEDEKERQKVANNKEKLRREMDNYLKNYKEIQRQRELEEKKVNELIEELNATFKAQQDANRAKLRNAKKELFNSVLKGREDQVKEKKERERKEEESRNKEIELLNLQIEQQKRIREDYEKRCAEKRAEYGQQLKQQMKEFEETKRLKKLEEEEYNRQVMLMEEKRVQEIKDILANHTALPMHPWKALMLKNPPKYDRGQPCPK